METITLYAIYSATFTLGVTFLLFSIVAESKGMILISPILMIFSCASLLSYSIVYMAFENIDIMIIICTLSSLFGLVCNGAALIKNLKDVLCLFKTFYGVYEFVLIQNYSRKTPLLIP